MNKVEFEVLGQRDERSVLEKGTILQSSKMAPLFPGCACFFCVPTAIGRGGSFPVGSVPAAMTPSVHALCLLMRLLLFVHQRQRSARSHSALRLSLNPSPRPRPPLSCSRAPAPTAAKEDPHTRSRPPPVLWRTHGDAVAATLLQRHKSPDG